MKYAEIGSTRNLVLDDAIVACQPGTKRIFHEWMKDPQNPILVKEYEWEGVGPFTMGSVIHDPVSGHYNMGYCTYHPRTGDYRAGLAVSDDGLHWQRNPDGCPKGGALSIAVNPNRKAGEYRYFTMDYMRETGQLPGRAMFRQSRDGFEWEPFPSNPWWEGPSDVINIIWDSGHQCYASYHKLWLVKGTTADGQLIRTCFSGFDLVQENMNRVRITGREIFPEPHDASYLFISGKNGKNDGGGGMVTQDIATLRVIGRAESKDFIHWYHHEIVFSPDEQDEIDVQYYGMPVFEYEGMYMAFPRYFEGISGRMDVRFAFSRDGTRFSMPDRKLVLACGQKGDWDSGMILVSQNPLRINNQLCLYYGAANIKHTEHIDENTSYMTGRAWLRIDGFASLNGGLAITKPVVLQGSNLFINASGKVGIKLRKLDGSVIAGAEWSGDSTQAVVSWQSGGMKHYPLRIEFSLSDGFLFSFWTE